MTFEGQTAANDLQIDLLRLAGREDTAADSPAAGVSIPLCSRCNLIPIHGELQVTIQYFCTIQGVRLKILFSTW